MSIGSKTSSVTLLMAYADPTLGMERAALRLAALLGQTYTVRIVTVAGRPPEVAGVSSLTLGPHASRSGMLARVWRLLRRRAQWTDETVVLVGPWLAVPALLVRRRDKGRLVVWEHSLMREQIATTPARRVLWWIARRLYRRAKAVVAVSAPLADVLAKALGRDLVTVIPNLVSMRPGDVDRPTRDSHDPMRVLSVGSLTRNKRHDLALSAVAATPGVELVIYGDGPERVALRTRVRELGIQSRVVLNGQVEHEVIMDAMAQSDVLLHASAGETFGLVFVEAAEQGLPVIAAANRVSEWMIPAFVPGVTFANEGELREHLSRLPRPTQEQVQAARERRQREFDPDAIAEAWDLVLVTSPGSSS